MSDSYSIRACIGKIQAIKSLAELIWKEVQSWTTILFMPRLRSLGFRYNEIFSWISTNFPEIGIQMSIVSIPNTDVSKESSFKAYLQDILIGLNTAENGLELKLKPTVEPRVIDRLDSIRKELGDFEDKGLDLNLIKNIQTALEEAE